MGSAVRAHVANEELEGDGRGERSAAQVDEAGNSAVERLVGDTDLHVATIEHGELERREAPDHLQNGRQEVRKSGEEEEEKLHGLSVRVVQ